MWENAIIVMTNISLLCRSVTHKCEPLTMFSFCCEYMKSKTIPKNRQKERKMAKQDF